MASNEENGDIDIELQTKAGHGDDAKVLFIQPNHKNSKGDMESPKIEFSGLSKEELMQYANDPFWKKVRLILFILFWVVWIGMLVAAIVIIVITPKCPKKPKLDFWQKETGYVVDAFAFKDTNGDQVGDIEGLGSKFTYIKKQLNAGFIILDPIFAGQFTNDSDIRGSTIDFMKIDEKLGTIDQFATFVKNASKQEIEVILTLDPSVVSSKHTWFTTNKDYFIEKNDVTWKGRTNKSVWVKCDGAAKEYYSFLGNCEFLDLNLKNEKVVSEIKSVLNFWMDKGVRGFLMPNAPTYIKDFDKSTSFLCDSYAYAEGQFFQEGSLSVLQAFRGVLDEKMKKTDKSRVLMLEPGDFGCASQTMVDGMPMYLTGKGNDTLSPAAHMIMSYEFVRNRGWKTRPTDLALINSKIDNYIKSIPNGDFENYAIVTATSTNIMQNYVPSIAASFLVPGTPLIYYGMELGMDFNETLRKNPDFLENGTIRPVDLGLYPKNKRSVVYLESKKTDFTSHYIYNHLPMPWCDDTKQLSEDCWKVSEEIEASEGYKGYRTKLTDSNTVAKMTAIGQQNTLFQLISKLAELRKESLLWGKLEWIKPPIYKGISLRGGEKIEREEMFYRKAEGFDTYVVVILDREGGSLLPFDKKCPTLQTVFTFPVDSKLPLNENISGKAVWIESPKPSVHIFKCVSV